MLAGAPGNSFGFSDLHLFRLETGAFMGTIAKRLAPRSSARAPPISSWFHLLHNRRFLINNRLGHNLPFSPFDTLFLAVRAMHLRGNFESKPIQSDESGGIVLIICLGRVSFHRGDMRIIETHWGFSPGSNNVALI